MPNPIDLDFNESRWRQAGATDHEVDVLRAAFDDSTDEEKAGLNGWMKSVVDSGLTEYLVEAFGARKKPAAAKKATKAKKASKARKATKKAAPTASEPAGASESGSGSESASDGGEAHTEDESGSSEHDSTTGPNDGEDPAKPEE